MIVKLLTKHHLEEHSDQGLSVCIFLNIFLTGRSHIIKLWNNNQISGHFLVAFLDASNVAHFSCRFARKNGPQRRIPPPPPRTIPHWNSLPPSVANTQSTEEFRALLI